MPISTECPNCKGRVRLPDSAAGKRFRCPKCKGVILGPGAQPPAPTIRPMESIDPGFVDAPQAADVSSPFEEHLPITEAAKHASFDSFNPFDDGARDGEDDKKKRYYQPKDDYNPFADPNASAPAVPGASAEALFDFGAEEPPASNAPSDELDFGGPSEGTRRRR